MATATAETRAASHSHSFFWRRLHSITGVLPLGAFLIEHFASNAAVLSRHPRQNYGEQVKFLNGLPFVLALEILCIYVPLAFHGLYGLWITKQSEPNALRFSWWGNWAYTWQRISGIIVLAFILWHTWTARFSGVSLPDHPFQSFAKMQAMMANNWIFAWFIIGITTVCYHFAYGLFLFVAKWGIAIGNTARRYWTYACWIIFLVLAYAGLASALVFRNHWIYPIR